MIKRREAFDEAANMETEEARVPRTKEPFILLTASRFNKLMTVVDDVSFIVWILLVLNFKRRNQSFVMPTEQLAKEGGRDRKGITLRNQQRALRKLEQCGFIMVERQPNKPPIIRVL